MSVAIFDLDRTLIDAHSGFAWVRHELVGGHLSWRYAAWVAGWMVRERLGRSQGLEEAHERAVQEWAGQREDELAARGRAFAMSELVWRMRPGARQAVAMHRARGDRMVMATASSTLLAEPIARHFGMELIAATRLEVADGRLTGRIAASALGPGKQAQVEAWAAREGIDLGTAHGYSDSWHDEPLLASVGHPVAVNPDARLRETAKRRNWVLANWGRANRRRP